jgi:hypothetical protein
MESFLLVSQVIIYCTLILFFYVIIHEIGHLAAMKLLKREVRYFIVGQSCKYLPPLISKKFQSGLLLHINLLPRRGSVNGNAQNLTKWELVFISISGHMSTAIAIFLLYFFTEQPFNIINIHDRFLDFVFLFSLILFIMIPIELFIPNTDMHTIARALRANQQFYHEFISEADTVQTLKIAKTALDAKEYENLKEYLFYLLSIRQDSKTND